VSAALFVTVLLIAACGLVYQRVAGALASYLLGDSVLQFLGGCSGEERRELLERLREREREARQGALRIWGGGMQIGR
jgi:hypothetical protein